MVYSHKNETIDVITSKTRSVHYFGNSIPVSEFESVSFDFDSFNLKRRVLYTEWALIPAGDSKFFRLSVVFIALILLHVYHIDLEAVITAPDLGYSPRCC